MAYMFSSPSSSLLLFAFLLLFSIRLSASRYLEKYANFSIMLHVSSVGLVTTVRAGRPKNIVDGFLIAARDLCLLWSVRTGFGPTQLSEYWGHIFRGRRASSQRVKLTTRLHLVPKLKKKKRNYNSTPPYASMACSRTNLHSVYGSQYTRNG